MLQPAETSERRPLWPAIRRGLARTCPCCGRGPAFAGYLRVVPHCVACAAPLGEIRADDFPPYLTIFAVGHVIVPTLLLVEQIWSPSTLFQMLFWPSLSLALALLLLRPIKGGVLGLMWALSLTGHETQ